MPQGKEEIYYLPESLYFSPLKLYLAGITYLDREYRINRPNGATHYILEYVVRGKGHLHYGDDYYLIEEGDVYLLHPNIPHEYYADSVSPWEKLWFNVGGKLLDSLVDSYNFDTAVHFPKSLLYGEFKEGLEIIKSNSRTVHNDLGVHLHKIFSRLSVWQSSHPDRCKSQLGILLREYIDMHFREEITLEKLSTLIKKSEAQMLRIFRQDWGVSPNVYLQHLRVSCAKKYLEHTTERIANISLMIGLKDEFYFSNWFKHKTGLSPRAYRERFQIIEN